MSVALKFCAGERMVVAVGGRDEFGNSVTEGGVEVEACIKIYASALKPKPPVFLVVEVIDRRNGTFEMVHAMKDAGEFEVSSRAQILDHY